MFLAALVICSTPWIGPVDHVDTIEINIWHRGGIHLYRSIIYRDADGSIVDWRWHTPEQIPTRINGKYMAVWFDKSYNLMRTIYCNRVIYIYSKKEDREITGRKTLPENKRRKLWTIP